MNNRPTLVFQAPVSTRSGYGDHARDLLYSLRELDKFDIKIISTRWGTTPMDALNANNEFHMWIINNILPQLTERPDIYVQVTVPNEFQPIGHYNIGITAAIETTLFLLIASVPLLFFFEFSINGKIATAGISFFDALEIISSNLSMEYLKIPGIDLISCFLFLPSQTKTGNIKSDLSR